MLEVTNQAKPEHELFIMTYGESDKQSNAATRIKGGGK